MSYQFTTLQRQCIYYLARGKSEAEIADILSISIENIEEWEKIPEFLVEVGRRNSELSLNPPVQYEKPKNRWTINTSQLIIILAIVFGVIICVAGFAFVRFVGAIAESQVDIETEVKPVMEQFLFYLKDKDISHAYYMFSGMTQDKTPISNLKDMTNGANYVIVDQFEALDIENWQVVNRNSVGTGLPAGVYVQLSGSTHYANNFDGDFTALLRKEDGKWRIVNFNIVVPPKKFEDYFGDTKSTQ